jgi:LEA14-like dessication related protein
MKKIIIIILTIVTILNIIAGSFLYLDVQQMSIPETQLTLELINITADEAILQATLSLHNPNPFPIFLQNLSVITTADTGELINHLSMDCGETKAHETRTFTSEIRIDFNGSLPGHLISNITGTFGTMFLGVVKKTFPLKLHMETFLNDILEQFSLPHIYLAANFSEITQEGINYTGIIDITNPNTIDLSIENISVSIKSEKDIPVGSLAITGKKIPAHTSQQFTGKGQLLLKALDAETLHMMVNGKVIIYAAGIKKPMNFSLTADIVPPSLEQLLSDVPTEASLTGNYKYSLKKGLRDEITFKIKNPNKITLVATDITVRIYRVDNNKSRIISNGTLPDGVIEKQSTKILQGDMYIPLIEIRPHLGERLIPDQLKVVLQSNITIQGLNQTIWVGVIGYQDFPFHRLFG